MRLISIVFAAALLVSGSNAARAIAPDDQRPNDGNEPTEDLLKYPLEDLLAVEATSAAKRPQRVADTAAAIYVITQEDIRRSGARSVVDLMRLVPGIETGEIDGNSTAVSVRGFTTRLANSVLVLVDGRAVNLSAMGGVMWDQMLEPLDTIERIEVVRGPGGAVWGANAVNGVVNIITKDASRTHDRAARLRFGTNDAEATVRAAGGAGMTRFRLTANGRQISTAVENSAGERDQLMSRALHIGGQSDTVLNDRDTVTVRASAGLNDFHPGDPRHNSSMANGRGSEATLLARWSRRHSADEGITTQGYIDHVHRTENGAEVSETVTDLQGDVRGHRNGHEIGAGFDFRSTNSRLSSTASVLDFAHSTSNDLLLGAYVQDGYWLLDRRLHGWLGIKAEYSSISGLAIQPSLRLLYRVNNALTVWGAWSRAVRTPAAFERTAIYSTTAGPTNEPFYAPIQVRVTARGTADLQASQLEAFEAGLRINPADWLSIDVTGYRNRYRDLIGYGPVDVDPLAFAQAVLTHQPLNAQYRIRNNSAAESVGIEFVATAALNDDVRLDLYGSAIDLSYRVTDAPALPGIPMGSVVLPQIPPLSVSTVRPVSAGIRLRADPFSQIEVDGSLRWVSGMHDGSTAARTGVDLRIGWNPDERTSLSLVTRNLLDREHIDFRESFPMAAPELIERQVSLELIRRF